MNNKKSTLFFITLLVLIIGISSTYAANITDDTNSNTQTTTDTISIDVASDTNIQANSDENKQIKTENSKETKKAKTHIITNQTVGNYFLKDNEYKLADNVKEGDTLDIQGNISNLDDKNFSMVINRPVNVISSTNDAYIDLNTTAGSLMGEDAGAVFGIVTGADGTNVTGIYLHNTQLWISAVSHVTLDNISAIVEEQRVGSGLGQTSIRNNATYITLKNSHISTTNNGGSSSVVLAWADHCTIENNTIEGIGNVGNIFYLTTYNLNNEPPEGVIPNSNNIIRNNRITGPATAATICYGMCLTGHNNTVDNNTITYSGTGITSQWGNSNLNNTIITNNKILGGASFIGTSFANTTYANNTFTGSIAFGSDKIENQVFGNNTITFTGSEVTNCTINGVCTLTNATMTNSTITSILKLNGNTSVSNCNIHNVSMETMRKDNNTLVNNNISTPVKIMRSKDNTLKNNTIKVPDDYAIQVSSSTGNIISGNTLIAKSLYGNAAIKLAGATNPNTIENNYPIETKTELRSSIKGGVVEITAEVTDVLANNTINQGVVVFKINDTTIGQAQVKNGVAVLNYTIPTSMNGDVEVVATYTDDKINSSSNTTTFTIIKTDIKYLDIKLDDIQSGDNIIINEVLMDVNNNPLKEDVNVEVLVDDVSVSNITVVNGQLNVEIPSSNIKARNHIIKVLVKESYAYNAKEFTSNIKVIGNAIVDVTANNPKTLGNINIIATVFDTENKAVNTGSVSFKINGKTLKDASGNVIYADVNKGFAKLNYELSDEYKTGNYEIKAIFTDESYNTKTATSKFVILRSTIDEINYPDIEIKTHENTTLNMTLKDTDGNALVGNVKVTIKLNGKTFTNMVVKDGQLNIDLNVAGQKAKMHTLTLKVGENGLYNAYSSDINLNILKRSVDVVVKTPQNSKAAQTFPVYVTVKEDDVAVNGGSVTFKVNGKTLKDADGNVVVCDVKDGQAVIMNKLPSHVYAGNASIVAIYKNDGYETANATTSFNVSKADIGDVNIVARSINKGKNTTLKATIYDESYTKVTSSAKAVVKINGKTFTQTRIVDGKLDVNFDTSSLKAGSTYNVTVVIGENKLYNSKVLEVPLTIKA